MLLGSATLDVAVEADRIEYDANANLVRGDGNVVVRQGDIEISGARGTYREQSGQSILTGGVTLKSPEWRLEAQRLVGNHRDRKYLLEGNVVYHQSPTSEVRGPTAIYIAASTNGGTATTKFVGPVAFRQPSWQATARAADVTASEALLRGDVRIYRREVSPSVAEAGDVSLPADIHLRVRQLQVNWMTRRIRVLDP
jgi:lipopolysaccharide export system protein LptA